MQEDFEVQSICRKTSRFSHYAGRLQASVNVQADIKFQSICRKTSRFNQYAGRLQGSVNM
ncbi:hypothetical protein DPMN_128816 [Dreissena polymorpha]|uniref:Uncharacterized protein n=1 Tax=Dreissena polymorpha TaxID=45954 RepID=A0A9D4H4M3_DREPO|nr:hypothetical protein DPMN_128816 [Dreissena polymorpha]